MERELRASELGVEVHSHELEFFFGKDVEVDIKSKKGNEKKLLKYPDQHKEEMLEAYRGTIGSQNFKTNQVCDFACINENGQLTKDV